MICYIYDGSFEGLLTAIYEAYYRKDNPEEFIKNDEFFPTLLTKPVHIHTNNEKADRVYNAIKDKISNEALKYIFYVFLSDLKNSSTLIYKYVRLGFKVGKDTDMHLYNEIVLSVHKITKNVINEYHRMLGFVRFKIINGDFYYAPIEPDHNILELITPHFVKRFITHKFIIHDRKRRAASIYDGRSWCIIELSINEGEELLKFSKDVLYENLWKEYFKSASIEHRKNSKLQKRNMPERYRKFMPEVN